MYELRLRNKSLKKKTGTYECEFYISEKYTWLQYEKRQIQAPGTTSSTFGDEVGMEGGHGNCCRFATLTGVHQQAHTYLPCEIVDQWKSSELEQNGRVSYKKNWEVEVVPVVDLSTDSAKTFFFCGHCDTGGLFYKNPGCFVCPLSLW